MVGSKPDESQGYLFFWTHECWHNTDDVAESICSLGETARGEVIIEAPRLADFKIFNQQNVTRVAELLYSDDELRAAIAELDPGKYRLTRPESSSSLRWVLQRDDTIADMVREVFEKEIDPAELAHCRGLQFIQTQDLVIGDLDHGLGPASLRGETFFLKQTGRKPKELFIKEVTALCRLSHPNIVTLKGCVLNETRQVVGFLTEFAERGDLHQHLDSPAHVKRKWVLQVADALRYIQSVGIVYEDVKCANIVVIEGQAKLVDFDGGYSPGHWKEGFESFPLAVLLEKLVVPNVEELVGDAKTGPMPLSVFQERLAHDFRKNQCQMGILNDSVEEMTGQFLERKK